MDFNTIAMLVGAAVFLCPTLVMVGWAWREKQHGITVLRCKENVTYQRNVLIEMHNADIAKERTLVRELELGLQRQAESIESLSSEVDKYRELWKFADTYRKAIVEVLVTNNIWAFNKHGNDPKQMVVELVKCETKKALDPAINKAAKNLHTRGVRKGAKAGREQMRKLMQKSIDNQAEYIQALQGSLENNSICRVTYSDAVHNVLNDKVGLVGVRKSIKKAIAEEVTRLREIAFKEEV